MGTSFRGRLACTYLAEAANVQAGYHCNPAEATLPSRILPPPGLILPLPKEWLGKGKGLGRQREAGYHCSTAQILANPWTESP